MERKDTKREVWIDWMRVAACFFVMVTHCCEPFYYGGEGTLLLTQSDAVWLSIINTLVRASVALFVVASSYLLFPLHYTSTEFVRKRAVRVLIPFLFWTVVYALVWGETIRDLGDLLLNFNYAAGHLWFVYMLIGLYALMPLLSPWAEKVQKTELRVYLAIWLFTTTIPSLLCSPFGRQTLWAPPLGSVPCPPPVRVNLLCRQPLFVLPDNEGELSRVTRASCPG